MFGLSCSEATVVNLGQKVGSSCLCDSDNKKHRLSDGVFLLA